MIPPDAEEMEVWSSGGHEESQDSQYEVGTFSQIVQSQPATQPLDESMGMETVSQGLEDGVWGQLFALWDFLRDKTLNGTWINRNRIGKEGMWLLEYNTKICFTGPKKKVRRWSPLYFQ